MVNFSEFVDTVYHWMRTGLRPDGKDPQPPMDRPGAFAAERHKRRASHGETEWQGYFRRHFCSPKANTVLAEGEDPWAA